MRQFRNNVLSVPLCAIPLILPAILRCLKLRPVISDEYPLLDLDFSILSVISVPPLSQRLSFATDW